MRTVTKGTRGEFSMRVGHEHLASQFKDPLLPPVLATPVMIMMMENAALNAIRPFLDPGESCVGTIVNVRHLAATPMGQAVRAEAEVTEADGRRIAFTVRAYDEREEIGAGTHERMVIDMKRFDAKLAEKAGTK